MFNTDIDIKQVEISGEALNSFISGFPEYLQEIALSVLYTYDISSPSCGSWYNFNNYLKALSDIGQKFGEDTLYQIGKQALACALIPKNIKNFKDALNAIEEAFALNHRNGEICWVSITDLNLSCKRVELYMENPYPYEINRGILTALAREFNPFPQIIPDVTIDETDSIRTKGKYIIDWQ